MNTPDLQNPVALNPNHLALTSIQATKRIEFSGDGWTSRRNVTRIDTDATSHGAPCVLVFHEEPDSPA